MNSKNNAIFSSVKKEVEEAAISLAFSTQYRGAKTLSASLDSQHDYLRPPINANFLIGSGGGGRNNYGADTNDDQPEPVDLLKYISKELRHFLMAAVVGLAFATARDIALVSDQLQDFKINSK